MASTNPIVPRRIRVLMVEDSDLDAELIAREMHLAGFEPAITRVINESEFSTALRTRPDVILADYSLPQFSALRMLRVLRQQTVRIPVIIISGSVGDDLAAECIKEGASDYLLKDRLGRLGHAIASALEHGELERHHVATEEELRTTGMQLEHLLEYSPAIIYELVVEPGAGAMTFVSDNVQAFFGVPASEARGSAWWNSAVHPEDRSRALAARASALSLGESRTEYRLRRKDGTFRRVEDRMRAVRDENGRPVALVGAWIDVTERRDMADSIAAVERRISRIRVVTGTLVAAFVAIVIIAALAGMNLFVPALQWVLAHSETVVDEIVGTVIFLAAVALFHSSRMLRASREEIAARRETQVALKELQAELEMRVQKRTAELVAINESLSAEVAERKRTQQALNDERALMRMVIDQIPDCIYVKDRDARFVLANEATARVIGAEESSRLLGKTDADFFGAGQATLFRADDARVAEGSSILNQEETVRAADGNEHILLTTKLPLRDAKGEITGLVGVGRDITFRKRMEAELLRAQRVETIGRLASGIAHDMNNILAPIMMAAHLLRTPTLAAADVEKTLRTIEVSARRGADLVKQLLVFGRGRESARIRVDVKKLILELKAVAEETFPRNITFKLELEPDLWPVTGDETQLHQILLNLCVNARDAMPIGGVLSVVARNTRLDAATAQAHPPARPGPHVCIEISDTGIGIPPEIIHRIFDPFFTTKEEGKGTGLGLATVQGIVESHAGFIEVESSVGVGSSFRLHLPADSAAAGPSTEQPPATAKGRGELILIVDDEIHLRDVLRRAVIQYNYDVIEAADGTAALQMLQRHPQVRLVITDLDMPNGDGVALIRAMKALQYDIPVIVATGVVDGRQFSARVATLSELGVADVMTKPFSIGEVLARIQACLGKAQNPA